MAENKKIVRLHHNIDTSGGVMVKPNVAWGNNALQTITIARHTPFNPQQAVGYKGIVDYTSSPVTSDLTLDCILTENTVAASENSTIYNFADKEVFVGQESYVLTSCNINFQAGNPATVNYGYITAGLADALLANANPKVLTAGEEAAFAIVMGEDGQGVYLLGTEADGTTTFRIPAGVQTLGFTASLNRNQILDVRSSSPIQFVTTYPLDLSVNLEVLQSMGYKDPYGEVIGTTGTTGAKESLIKKLNAITVGCGASTELQGLLTKPTGNREGAAGAPDELGKQLVKASGLMLTEEGESVNVGGNLTFTYNLTAADIEIPLDYVPDTSNSDGSNSDE